MITFGSGKSTIHSVIDGPNPEPQYIYRPATNISIDPVQISGSSYPSLINSVQISSSTAIADYSYMFNNPGGSTPDGYFYTDQLLYGTQDWTIESWVKTSNASTYQNWQFWMGQYDTPTTANPLPQGRMQFGTFQNDSNGCKYIMYMGANSVNNNGYSNMVCGDFGTTYPHGVWRHVAIERHNNTFRLYIDGSVRSTVNNNMPVRPGRFSIGHGLSDVNRVWAGQMANIRVSDVARYQGSIGSNTPLQYPQDDPNTLLLMTGAQGLTGDNNTYPLPNPDYNPNLPVYTGTGSGNQPTNPTIDASASYFDVGDGSVNSTSQQTVVLYLTDNNGNPWMYNDVNPANIVAIAQRGTITYTSSPSSYAFSYTYTPDPNDIDLQTGGNVNNINVAFTVNGTPLTSQSIEVTGDAYSPPSVSNSIVTIDDPTSSSTLEIDDNESIIITVEVFDTKGDPYTYESVLPANVSVQGVAASTQNMVQLNANTWQITYSPSVYDAGTSNVETIVTKIRGETASTDDLTVNGTQADSPFRIAIGSTGQSAYPTKFWVLAVDEDIVIDWDGDVIETVPAGTSRTVSRYKSSQQLISITGKGHLKFSTDTWVRTFVREVKPGSLFTFTSLEQTFDGCQNATFSTTGPFVTAGSITSLKRTFYKCEQAFAGGQSYECLETLDVSQVTDMHRTFGYCRKMDTPSVNNWDTSSVVDMEYMFQRNANTAWSTIDVSSWDVSSVTNFSGTFSGCTNMNNDISAWNVANGETFWMIFDGADSFNQDLSNWPYPSSIIDVNAIRLFQNGRPLNWPDSKMPWAYTTLPEVTGITGVVMEAFCPYMSNRTVDKLMLNGNITVDWGDGSPLETYTNANGLLISHTYSGTGQFLVEFRGTGSIEMNRYGGDQSRNWSNINRWGTLFTPTAVTNMFMSCDNLRSTASDIADFDMSNITRTYQMFARIEGNAGPIDLSGLDISNVTQMDKMFWLSPGISSFNISGWDVSNVTNMRDLFRGSSANRPTISDDLSGWDVSNVTTYNDYDLNTNWDASKKPNFP